MTDQPKVYTEKDVADMMKRVENAVEKRAYAEGKEVGYEEGYEQGYHNGFSDGAATEKEI